MLSAAAVLGEIKNFAFTNVLSGSEPLIIYGAGGYGRDVAEAFLKQGRVVLGFLDRNQTGEIEGLPCRHPETDLRSWRQKHPTVLVGLHSQTVNPVIVRNELLALGFPRVYLPVEYHHLLEPQLGPRYWLGERDLYREHLEHLREVFALLADEKSRALFISLLEYRALGRIVLWPALEPTHTYFPLDLPSWPEALSWVDGGAYNGDTLRSFPLERYRCPEVYLFEPELKNFAALQSAICQFKENSPATRIMAWPCGLGRENAVLKFRTGLGAASTADSGGDAFCPITSLDTAIHGSRVNLIKLDIEGAEPEALQGAEHTITDQRPGLAVCIYHTPAHLWEIPLMLAQKHPRYHFYLRMHAENCFDLILYALPF